MRHWDHRSRPFLHRAITLLLFFSSESLLNAQITQFPSREVERRVDAILSKMTLDEKLTIIGGINDFYHSGYSKLGCPHCACRMGRSVCTIYGPRPHIPPGLLAASWTPNLRAVLANMGQTPERRSTFHPAPGMNIIVLP